MMESILKTMNSVTSATICLKSSQLLHDLPSLSENSAERLPIDLTLSVMC